MRTLARVDTDGNVIEFPYRVGHLRAMPNDAVVCDTELRKQPVKWYQALWYDRVEKEDGNYVVYYRVGTKKFSSDAEKSNVLSYFVNLGKENSNAALQEGKITQEQHASNIALLDAIVVEDSDTYDKYHDIVLQ